MCGRRFDGKNTNKLSFRNEKLEYLVILNVQGYGQAVPLVFFPKLIDWLAVAMPYVRNVQFSMVAKITQ